LDAEHVNQKTLWKLEHRRNIMEVTSTSSEITKCLCCGKTPVLGTIACQRCWTVAHAAGFTWDSVNMEKNEALRFICNAVAVANAEQAKGIKEEEDRDMSQRIGQIALADHPGASLLRMRMPGVVEVARFTQGHGMARLEFVVLEGPGLPPVMPGEVPLCFLGLESVTHEPMASSYWVENIRKAVRS
jgi:hypothetical protein